MFIVSLKYDLHWHFSDFHLAVDIHGYLIQIGRWDHLDWYLVELGSGVHFDWHLDHLNDLVFEFHWDLYYERDVFLDDSVLVNYLLHLYDPLQFNDLCHFLYFNFDYLLYLH